ncbi:hypothetical protein [Candidatus Chlamydia sanziniae]|uniref:hypothetical protein n=1 Tax=Candidatus Chlamydia sanziniae TaxID=1806891 RepID=UPI001E362DE1|nr:hypothetical protein [Candidatus Chlamydia sanziniae]
MTTPLSVYSSQPMSTRTIKQNIFLAKPGDYTVLSRGTQRIFLLVKSMTPDAVWLEILDFPCLTYRDRTLTQKTSWKIAIHQLNSSSKIFVFLLHSQYIKMFALNMETHTLVPLTSFEEAPLFSKILQLSLLPAPKELIKIQGKNQTPWSPKVSIEGTPQVSVATEMWHGLWPNDLSPLSGTDVLMYFTFPEISVFPLWASIQTPKGPVTLRTIDVGHEATSPYTYSYPQIPLP